MTARPFTPEQVAAYWGCSANHVRNLIHRGELRAFRLGRRLFRIPAEAIGEYERAQELASQVVLDEYPPVLSAVPPEPAMIVIQHSKERKS